MITGDQLQKIGVPGLLAAAIVYLLSELAAAKQRIEHLEAQHSAFVQMVITRYQIPLAQ